MKIYLLRLLISKKYFIQDQYLIPIKTKFVHFQAKKYGNHIMIIYSLNKSDRLKKSIITMGEFKNVTINFNFSDYLKYSFNYCPYD
jgi:hypothetical protein